VNALLAAQLLDTQIATRLRDFSYAHQRQEAFKALQLQAQTMPAVAQQMQAMMAHMERMSEQLNDRLLTNQESFHSHVKGVYTDLARAVDQSLRESLIQGANAAGDSMRPVLQSAMADIAQDNKRMHEQMLASMGQSLQGFSHSFEQRSTALATRARPGLRYPARADLQQPGPDRARNLGNGQGQCQPGGERSIPLAGQFRRARARAHGVRGHVDTTTWRTFGSTGGRVATTS
jgi:hypothetical protein